MRSRKSMLVITMMLLGAEVIPVRLGAQEQKQEKIKHHQYKLVDIGTFGGPASFIHALAGGSPNPINSQGATVGGATTAVPTPSNSFLCEGPFVHHAFELRNSVVTDLGTLAGADNCSVATSINANGEIAGYSENGLIDPLVGLKEIHAVRWRDGEVQDLGTLGGNGSGVAQINNRGQIAGVAMNAIPDPFSLIYLPLFGSSNGTQARAFLWQDGAMQDLHTLGGPDANAFGLNERGQVIGISYTNSTPNPTTGIPTQDPFLWTNGRMIGLGTLGGTVGGATQVNNRGQVIGSSNLAGDQISDPFLWDDGKLIDLNTQTTGGNPITANAINDAGEIVGGGAFSSRVFDAYVWRDGAATDVGTLSDDCFSEAIAINSGGQVVGNSVSCDGSKQRAFLWENGSMVDLNTLIPPNSNLQLVAPLAINDGGEVVGNGVSPGCGDVGTCGHAFVLIPCGGDHADAEGCNADASQNNAASVSQSPLSVTPASAATVEMMARIRARLARRFQVPVATGPAR